MAYTLQYRPKRIQQDSNWIHIIYIVCVFYKTYTTHFY